MNITIRQALLAPLLLLMLFPWTKLTSTFDSDIQPYSLVYGTGFLLACMLGSAARPRWTVTKVESDLLLIALLLFIEAIMMVLVSDGPDVIRGVYQYLNGAILFFVIFFVLQDGRHANYSLQLYRLTLVGFCIWVGVGIIQLLIDRTFLTSFVNRSVLTNDRGAISLSSEPGYFGYTLIFFTLFFLLYGKKRLAVLSAFLIPALTMSAASVASLCILIGILVTYRYGIKSLLILALLGTVTYFAGDILVRQPEISDYRAVKLIGNLYDDKSALLLDGSFNIRLVHLYYSHLGFIESFGLPNGVTHWPSYLAARVGEISLLWDTGLDQTTRINSGMGGILFEGGWLSVAVMASILILTRASTQSRRQFALHTAIFIYLFYIGFNFRTPFLYLLILAALMQNHADGTCPNHPNKNPKLPPKPTGAQTIP